MCSFKNGLKYYQKYVKKKRERKREREREKERERDRGDTSYWYLLVPNRKSVCQIG